MYPSGSVPELCQTIRAPALLITGWYDWCLGDALYSWEQLIRYGDEQVRARSRLLIAPTAHNAPGCHEGSDSHPELKRTYRTGDNLELLLHWFETVRKGAVEALPVVTYYLMGANEWRTASAWPPAEAKTKTLFLGAGGTLTLQAPQEASAPIPMTTTRALRLPDPGGSIPSNLYRPAASTSAGPAAPDVVTYTTPAAAE
jgi:predicted acyl esterase